MVKLTKLQLGNLSLGQLINMLNPDYTLGATHFPTEWDEDGEMLPNKKKFCISHVYNLIAEVNQGVPKESWELFGYPLEIIESVKTMMYGESPKDVLIKFFITYPELIINY